MNKLHFQIITPDKIAYDDEIDSLTLPTTEGEITILPNHIPLVTAVKPGEIMIRKDQKTHQKNCPGRAPPAWEGEEQCSSGPECG